MKKGMRKIYVAILIAAALTITLAITYKPNESKVNFTPKPGEYLFSRGNKNRAIHDCSVGSIESKIRLIDVNLKYGKLMTNQTSACSSTSKAGDHVVIVYGTIKNEYDKDYYIAISADLYNSNGKKVGQIIDPPICKFTVAHLKAKEMGNFELHVRYDKEDNCVL